MILTALEKYNASLDENDCIISAKGKQTGVCIVAKGNRLRYEVFETGTLLASSPQTEKGIENFLEKYWYWDKVKN